MSSLAIAHSIFSDGEYDDDKQIDDVGDGEPTHADLVKTTMTTTNALMAMTIANRSSRC